VNPALYHDGANAMSPEHFPSVIMQDYVGQIYSGRQKYPDVMSWELRTPCLGMLHGPRYPSIDLALSIVTDYPPIPLAIPHSLSHFNPPDRGKLTQYRARHPKFASYASVVLGWHKANF